MRVLDAVAVPSALWSESKQCDLLAQLQGFWAQDEWEMSLCPLVDQSTYTIPFHLILRFACGSPRLSGEIKYVFWQKFQKGEWRAQTWRQHVFLHRLTAWLTHIAPSVPSLLVWPLEKWELSFRTFLEERNWFVCTSITQRIDRHQRVLEQPRRCHSLSLLSVIYRTLQEAYDEREEYEKEIWDMRKLIDFSACSNSNYRLNFTKLAPLWLKKAAKQYLRYSLATHAASHCQNRLKSLHIFAEFLMVQSTEMCASDIDRAFIIRYLSYIAERNFVATTRADYLSGLRQFFELAAREGWADVTEKRLLYDDDFPRAPRPQPRWIPSMVLDQLNQYLDELPPPIMRMILVMQECGRRFGELCAMPYDCLSQDASGDWFLHYRQYKMKKDHSIPVSREVVAVIQEQQKEVLATHGSATRWLFPNRKNQPVKQYVIMRALNMLSYKRNICDANGQAYHFQSHQFRHSVGTRMINNGVPQHIVQRYLGHESPEMTNRYANVYDQTMKEAFAEFRGKVVDITGRVVEQRSVVDSSDLQWVKKHVLAQALSNGRCALPLVAGECPHANACLTCVHFRTDASFLAMHKAQLQTTQQLIHVSRSNGWTRQGEMNERVETNLQKIISTLEAPHET